ncbi:MAG: thioredoxin domain-containing protein [Planctomycetota bacterium]
MKATENTHANRLIHATSPYLLQHAHNPVDWYEWGEEALQRALREDKPIFLSIGYSACHWCHVMEHESFENEALARVLNEHFVCIKVDREERPDLDEIYMYVTMQINDGRRGWPMSVFLTPQRLPIFAGTYFPPEQFQALCTRVAEAWNQKRTQIEDYAASFQAHLRQWAKGTDPIAEVLPPDSIARTADLLTRYFDPVSGGMGQGNKFPPNMAMELMLRVHARTGDAKLLKAVTTTLDRMANGGIYDHLGGGSCRYATDPDWLVPHFEKMLYDQALVSSIFLDAYQVTKKDLYRRRATEILDYCLADLQSPEGGFYSTRDADSEGMEGKYYVWTVEQVRAVLGDEDARLFCAYYDVTEQGNWDERFGHAPPGPKNILNVQRDAEVVAKLHGLPVDDLIRRLETMKAKMLTARQQRVPPGLDDKVLAGWNGLIIASLAKGARVLDEPKYATAAAAAADFVLTQMRKNGRLLRTYRSGQARLTAYLDDYAFMIEGLLNLYEATFDLRWLDQAVALNDTLIQYYYDATGGGFFYTASDGEELVVRTKNPHDGAIPSGNAAQATNLLRLAVLFERLDCREKAASIFRAFGAEAAHSPGAFERLLCALDGYHHGTKEVVVIGDPQTPDTRALLRVIYERYLPNKVVVLGRGAADAASAVLPLLKSRGMIDGKATAFVSENRVCKRPVTDPADLARQLENGK